MKKENKLLLLAIMLIIIIVLVGLNFIETTGKATKKTTLSAYPLILKGGEYIKIGVNPSKYGVSKYFNVCNNEECVVKKYRFKCGSYKCTEPFTRYYKTGHWPEGQYSIEITSYDKYKNEEIIKTYFNIIL